LISALGAAVQLSGHAIWRMAISPLMAIIEA